MLKNYLKGFSKIQVLMDACIMVISYLLAYYLRFHILNNVFGVFRMGVNERWYSVNVYTDQLVLMVALYLLAYFLLEVYTPIGDKLTSTKIFRIIIANILGFGLFLSALYLQKVPYLSRKLLFLFFVMNLILGIGSRMLCAYCLKVIHKKQQLV